MAGVVAAEPGRYASIGRKANQWRRAVAGLVAEGTAAGELRDIDRPSPSPPSPDWCTARCSTTTSAPPSTPTLIADLAVRALSR